MAVPTTPSTDASMSVVPGDIALILPSALTWMTEGFALDQSTGLDTISPFDVLISAHTFPSSPTARLVALAYTVTWATLPGCTFTRCLPDFPRP